MLGSRQMGKGRTRHRAFCCLSYREGMNTQANGPSLVRAGACAFVPSSGILSPQCVPTPVSMAQEETLLLIFLILASLPSRL